MLRHHPIDNSVTIPTSSQAQLWERPTVGPNPSVRVVFSSAGWWLGERDKSTVEAPHSGLEQDRALPDQFHPIPPNIAHRQLGELSMLFIAHWRIVVGIPSQVFANCGQRVGDRDE